MERIGNPNELSGQQVETGMTYRARACAATGRTTDVNGFIETGYVPDGSDQTTILSAAAVSEAARLLGFAPREEVETLATEFSEELDRKQEQLDELREKVEAAQKLEEARLLVAEAQKEG